jgi:hypothetical protein
MNKPGHPRFYELLKEIEELHSKKNHDYSGDNPLANLKMSEEIGIPAWKSVIVRMMDKWSRIKNFVNQETMKTKEESFIDTLKDNAVYSLLAVILWEEQHKTPVENAFEIWEAEREERQGYHQKQSFSGRNNIKSKTKKIN